MAAYLKSPESTSVSYARAGKSKQDHILTQVMVEQLDAWHFDLIHLTPSKSFEN